MSDYDQSKPLLEALNDESEETIIQVYDRSAALQTLSPGTVINSGQTRRLLQALNDENQGTINDCIKHESVKQWINDKVSVKLITNPRIKFVDDFESITCLCYASCCNTDGIVRQLVQAGADVRVADAWQQTPLYHACKSNVDVQEKVEFLLSCNASLANARNNNTPLIVIAGSEYGTGSSRDCSLVVFTRSRTRGRVLVRTPGH